VIASLRKQLKRNKWALIAYTILHSARVRWRFQQGKFDSITGSTHMKFSDEQSVAYCLRQYNEYFEYGHLTPEMLAGRTMLEYGPGDNVGVGLLFIAAGIRYYAATDKFDAIRDVEKERRIYQKLREGLTDDAARKRFDAAVDLSQGIVFNPERVKCVYGVGAEDADTQFKEPFDFLISRGVLQEIYEGEKLFTSMDKLLKPGGWMLHKVDHRDYGLFNANGFPALEFLTVSEGIYQLMAKKAAAGAAADELLPGPNADARLPRHSLQGLSDCRLPSRQPARDHSAQGRTGEGCRLHQRARKDDS
jgi:SAM-dependent methyltransferase